MPTPKQPAEDPKLKIEETAASEAPAESEAEKIGGPDDVILLDENDQPSEALTPKDLGLAEGQKASFRILHPKTQKTYEHAGTDADGRELYRPS